MERTKWREVESMSSGTLGDALLLDLKCEMQIHKLQSYILDSKERKKRGPLSYEDYILNKIFGRLRYLKLLRYCCHKVFLRAGSTIHDTKSCEPDLNNRYFFIKGLSDLLNMTYDEMDYELFEHPEYTSFKENK